MSPRSGRRSRAAGRDVRCATVSSRDSMPALEHLEDAVAGRWIRLRDFHRGGIDSGQPIPVAHHRGGIDTIRPIAAGSTEYSQVSRRM
ncbi:hypothetical protein GCM10018966_003420 [Streptomyces yanii]